MTKLTNKDVLSRLQKIDDIAIGFIENGSYENANQTALDTMKEILKLSKPAESTEIHKFDEIPHWIPVSERLPEEHEIEQDICDSETLAVVDVEREKGSDLVNVVVIDDETGKRFVCDDVTVNGKWVNFPNCQYTVTHWMPLPQPPKE